MRGQEEAALVGLHATKMFDITKGQEVWDMHSSPQYQLPHSCLCTTSFMFMHWNFTTTIGFVTWPPFLSYTQSLHKKGGQVTKPIVVVKFWCINSEVTDTVCTMCI